MVSLLSYLQHTGELHALPEPIIAFSGQTLSTLLVSDGMPLSRKMQIAVSADTKTTQWYLESVLHALRLQVSIVESESIEADELLTQAPYALVIGDEALKVFSGTKNVLLDVGFEFQRTFGMDPLYAISVSRGYRKFADGDWFRSAFQHFPKCAAELSTKLGISANLTKRYYENIRYSFDVRSAATMHYVSRSIRKSN